MIRIDNEIQLYFDKMKNVKECQIEVASEVFTGTVIQIGKSITNHRKKTKGVFIIVDGVLNV